MKNLAVKNEVLEVVVEPVAQVESEGGKVIEFATAAKKIAEEAEAACHIEGNLNSPDFDAFEAKYGFSFA